MNYCKKCGQQAAPGAVCCTNCGEKLENTENAARNTAYPQVKPKSDIKAIAVVWFAVGGLILLLCFIGGCMLLGGAGDMAHIRSVSGNSIDELFYQASGAVNRGGALAVWAAGLFGGGFFARLGLKELKK